MKAALDVPIDGGVMRSYRSGNSGRGVATTAKQCLRRERHNRSVLLANTSKPDIIATIATSPTATADEPCRGQASIESCCGAVGLRDPAGFTGSGSVAARRTIGKALSAIT